MAHSPPLPLVIDYHDKERAFTGKDEEGITIAIQSRDRIRPPPPLDVYSKSAKAYHGHGKGIPHHGTPDFRFDVYGKSKTLETKSEQQRETYASRRPNVVLLLPER